MIEFHYVTDFSLDTEESLSAWIIGVIKEEGCKLGDINYIFCDDAYLHDLNIKYLDHDTYTDIISFDYSVGKELHGDIFISVERVHENAMTFEVDPIDEMKRVMVHGVLHYCGYKDKSEVEAETMRYKENLYLKKLIDN